MKIEILLYICLLFLFPNFSTAADNNCAKEGMSAGGSVLGALRCCKGLVTTNSWTHANLEKGCNFPTPPGSSGSCIKCGDSKCDSENFENKCNCPKDCN